MNKDSTGKIIRELRAEKQLSQRQLAEMIPISRQAVSKWERNERIPDASSLLRLSDIFNVTINELLIGKRIQKTSITELENATLELIDISNKKIDESNNRFLITLITACILLISFLSYYFINSYNSIKVYKIYSIGNNFHTTNGLFIITKEKAYIKFGILKSNNENKVNNIKILYKKDNKERIIYSDKDLNSEIINVFGDDNYFPSSDIKTIINNSFLIINYDNNEEEIIKITFEKDFINKSLFLKKRKKETEDNYNKTNKPIEIDKEKLISTIENNWQKDNNSYFYEDVDKNYKFIYFELSKELTFFYKEEDSWQYDLTTNRIICVNQKECEENAISIIKEYILN